jgi:hypothetical protein
MLTKNNGDPFLYLSTTPVRMRLTFRQILLFSHLKSSQFHINCNSLFRSHYEFILWISKGKWRTKDEYCLDGIKEK